MKPPFDISGDLDTPVSAFMKLADFEPRFLLESVEGGERLARYSFIGFGKGLEVRLDRDGIAIGTGAPPGARRRPRSCWVRCAKACDVLRSRRRRLRACPLAGGLVGYSSYDVVRFFERLPARTRSGVPALHYVAPRSLLVFDHLTRGIALVHAGSEEERRSLRKEIIARPARRAAQRRAARAGTRRPTPAFSRDDFLSGVRRTQEYIAAGDVYQLVLSTRFAGRHELDPFQAYRALRLINPSPYMYYCALGDVTVVGSSPEALVKLKGGRAQLRPIAGTRPRSSDARDRSRPRDGVARRSERERRARDVGGPRAQRSRAEWRGPAASTSIPIAPSSATAT